MGLVNDFDRHRRRRHHPLRPKALQLMAAALCHTRPHQVLFDTLSD